MASAGVQSTATERAGQRLGNYAVTREAGRGGMSVVYEGLDERIGRRVAIKTVRVPDNLSPVQREGMVARLRREARANARLSHPNVVSVYDVGEEEGVHFLVMEYLEGQTLRDHLDAGPLAPDEAARILDQVADAVDAVHAEGVIHRDIKASNVMLLPDGRVKLMDFGVARQTDDTLLTQAGMMVGSPAYMAPELINGDSATQSSDLWSLGVLLYQMLAGHPPFASKNIPTVLYQVTHQDPEPIPGASARVQKVLTRALEKTPARRFSSGREMAAAFRAALAPAGAATAQAPRRRSLAAPLAAALLLLPAVVGALFGGRWLASHRRSAPVVVTRMEHPQLLSRPHHQSLVAKASALRAHPVPMPRVRVAASRQERAAPTVRTHRRHYRMAAPSIVPYRRPTYSSVTAYRSPQPRTIWIHHAPRAARPNPPNPPNKPMPANPPSSASPQALTGTWHGWQGIHSHDPATLTIQRSRGSSFDGVMTVRTPEHATVRVALTGRVSPGGGVTMRETRVLSSTKPRAWDLGFKSGQIGPNGQISGTDHDIKGRRAQWSFQR